MVSKCPRLSDFCVIGEDVRNTNTCVRVVFEIGHEALRRTKKTPEGFTHDWEVFVRGADNTEIHHFVEKVVFHLHTTFPKPKRAIKEPPYSVKESGYAGFIIPIDIYFKNKDEPKKVTFNYDLSLQNSGPPIKNVLRETFVFPNPPEDLRRRLIRGGGVGVVGAESGGQSIPTEKATVVEDSSSKHVAPPLIGKPKLGGADTPKKHKTKEHKIEEPRVSSSFADLFGPPIQKTTKVSPDPKKSSSTSPQISNKLVDKDKQSGKSSRPKDKDGAERSGSSKDRSRDHEKSKEKSSSSSSASKHSSPPSKPTSVPPLPPVKTDKDESKKPSHEDGSKEPKSSSSGEINRSEKKKKDKRNKDEKSSKKDRHKEREHGEKKHLVEKTDKQERADKTEKNDKQEKSGTENDKLKKPEKIEKNNVKELKEKEKESSHGDKSVRDTAKVAEKYKEKDKDKEKEKEKEREKEKEKDKEKEKHSKGDREKEKDKEKQRHKHKKKDKKDRKEDTASFKDREKDRDKLVKKEDSHLRNESKDHEKNGMSFESPSSITEIPNRKKSRSPSPVEPSVVPRDKPPQRPLKKLLDQLADHSSSDSELSAPSPEEVVDSKSPTGAVKPESNSGTTSKLVGIHKNSSVSGSKQKEKSNSRKEKKEKKDKEQGEKAEKDDANKKKKRKSSGKSKPDEFEPTAKTPRIEETKVEDEEEAMPKSADDDMDVEMKQEEVQVDPSKSDDDDDGSGSGKEEFGAPPAPECFTPDYVSQLKDLQHKIMTLEDNTELQRVVQVIAETGQYEITKKTFDFDLCALDRRTVKRLQDFFTASS